MNSNYMSQQSTMKKMKTTQNPQVQNVPEVFNPRKYERPGFPVDQIIQMKQAFDFFDKDKSGSLQLKEIQEAMQILGFVQNEESEVAHLIEAMDDNGDQKLDFEEYLQVMFANIAEKDTDDDLKQVFQDFIDLGNQKFLVDEDEEGDQQDRKKNKRSKHLHSNKAQIGSSTTKITIQMLRNIARQIGEDIEDEDLQEMMMRADYDDDGQVNFSDFKKIIKWKSNTDVMDGGKQNDKQKNKQKIEQQVEMDSPF